MLNNQVFTSSRKSVMVQKLLRIGSPATPPWGIRRGTLGTQPSSENQALALLETSQNSSKPTNPQLSTKRGPSFKTLGKKRVLEERRCYFSLHCASHPLQPHTVRYPAQMLLNFPHNSRDSRQIRGFYFKFQPAENAGFGGE